MKSKSKSEIAQAAGISTELLRRWMMVHRREIGAMGVKSTRQVLPPKVVRYMCRELGIDDGGFFAPSPPCVAPFICIILLESASFNPKMMQISLL